MTWELIEVKTEQECLLDDSGIYTVINRVVNRGYSKGCWVDIVQVRVDIMDDSDSPIISFIGKAEAVRKTVMRWIVDNGHGHIISFEHTSYIGSEIARANLQERFTQR